MPKQTISNKNDYDKLNSLVEKGKKVRLSMKEQNEIVRLFRETSAQVSISMSNVFDENIPQSIYGMRFKPRILEQAFEIKILLGHKQYCFEFTNPTRKEITDGRLS